MDPRLLFISGPRKDSTFSLSTDEIPAGRDSSNLLAISDVALSRRHCVFKREGTQFKLIDLESRNGTLVNGIAIKETVLHHGDQISIGDSVLIVCLEADTEEPAEGKVEFEDSPTQATVQIHPQEVLYLKPEQILQELPASRRLGKNLAVLLKASRVVHAIRDPEQLQEQILELLFEAVPAERGAILQDSAKNGRFASMFARHRSAMKAQPVRVSRTITQQVLERGFAILGADVAGSGPLSEVESIVGSSVRSLLCVPLTLFEKVTGCIYLDSANPAARFDEDHLQLAAAVAGICSVALENTRRLHWLEQENLRLATEINLDHNMVGESGPMKKVYQFLSRVASGDSTVLIEGESGTGKELAARAVHRTGPRSGKPFVAINCAAIPEGLLESELFGHERGAFTDAVSQKKGRLEVANGGVVFLDEIGELAPLLQVKLLRVLQEREFERVGGNRPIAVDIRLIAATNKDLEEAVKAGLFRADLFYRLNVVNLVMPALRDRREDIATLANHFVLKYSKKCKLKPRPISAEAMARLVNYDWPGNVRELENAIERALVLSLSDEVQPEDLPEALLERDEPPGVAAGKYHQSVKDTKKQLILSALGDAGGNFTEAARILGVHPNYLHRLVRNLDLRETAKSGADGRRSGKKLA